MIKTRKQKYCLKNPILTNKKINCQATAISDNALQDKSSITTKQQLHFFI
jgi:hypothetical protein